MKFWKKWTKRKIKKAVRALHDQKKYIKQLEQQLKTQKERDHG